MLSASIFSAARLQAARAPARAIGRTLAAVASISSSSSSTRLFSSSSASSSSSSAASIDVPKLQSQLDHQAALQTKTIEFVLVADFDPNERARLQLLSLPVAFEQYMIDLALSKEDRLALLLRYEEWGAARTAKWMLDHASSFLHKRDVQLTQQLEAKQASNKLQELREEYVALKARYDARLQRKVERVQQPIISDRYWLFELAEYASLLAGKPQELPPWARFAVQRRALEDYWLYIQSGTWPGIPTGASMDDVRRAYDILNLARSAPELAIKRAERLAKKQPELVRRFIEPALGVISVERAQAVSAAEPVSSSLTDEQLDELELYQFRSNKHEVKSVPASSLASDAAQSDAAASSSTPTSSSLPLIDQPDEVDFHFTADSAAKAYRSHLNWLTLKLQVENPQIRPLMVFSSKGREEEVVANVQNLLLRAPTQLQRCLLALEALLNLPAEFHGQVVSSFARAKLMPERLEAANVSDADVTPDPSENEATERLDRLLRLEVKLFSEIDRAYQMSRLQSPQDKEREYSRLVKEAKSLGINVARLGGRGKGEIDIERLREVVITVKFAQKFYGNEPVFRNDLRAVPDELDPRAPSSFTDMGAADQSADSEAGLRNVTALHILVHLQRLGFELDFAKRVADAFLSGDADLPEPSKLDAFQQAMDQRHKSSIAVGLALLRLQLEKSNQLHEEDINYVLRAMHQLELEQRSRRQTYQSSEFEHVDEDNVATNNVLLPNIRPVSSMPDSPAAVKGIFQDFNDFDGEDEVEREAARKAEWRSNTWEDVLASDKYNEETPVTNPLIDTKEGYPQQLDPSVCRAVYNTYKANPAYWTPLRLSNQFRLRLERIEAILTLWYMEDCAVARHELPAFDEVKGLSARLRPDGGPDDRRYDGVDYVSAELFQESSGEFVRERPEAKFLTQEDLERLMWKRSRPFRDFARRPNKLAGQVIPSLPGRHSVNRSKYYVIDTSQGRNHPAPMLTVRDENGVYRWATEKEYLHEVDVKMKRPRRRNEESWEYEWIRRRQVAAGFHYTLLGSAECPVAHPLPGPNKAEEFYKTIKPMFEAEPIDMDDIDEDILERDYVSSQVMDELRELRNFKPTK